MPTYRVDVEPEVLVWARTSIGMSLEEAAARLNTGVIMLRLWEEGAYSESQPTLVQLRRMAEVYRRPLAALYLPAPPKEDTPTVPDYRLLSAGESHAWSRAMHDTYRRVLMQREVAIELAEAAGESIQKLSLTLNQDTNIEMAAAIIRTWLDVSIEEQLEWKSEYQALNTWIAAVERHDILVMHSAGVRLEEMRGFAISEDEFPVIVLNGFDAPRGRIFTVMHELVHLLMHSSGLCNLLERRQPGSKTFDIEAYCNAVAGAVLLPRDEVVEGLLDADVHGPIAWPEATLYEWARRYQVSREVVLRRFVSLGYATLDQYFRNLYLYSQQYQAKREYDLTERERRKREGLSLPRPNTLQLRVRNLGRRYISDVLRAYSRRDINAAELSEYLETKVDHIPDVVRLLERNQ